MARSKQSARKPKTKKKSLGQQSKSTNATESDIPKPSDESLSKSGDIIPASAEMEVITLPDTEIVTLADTEENKTSLEEGETISLTDEKPERDEGDIIVDITGEDEEQPTENIMDTEPTQPCDEVDGSLHPPAIERIDDRNISITAMEATPLYDYSSVVSAGIMSDKISGEEPEAKKETAMSCWNCNGSHNLSECTQKRNPRVIAQNRKQFLKAKGSFVPNVRYHQDTEQKYAGMKPGAVSAQLKDALGLQEWQAPEFIYRMRVLGYPPGWLKDAEVHRAAVAIIDGDGSAMSHPEDEDGEIDKPAFKYEPDRLVSYPGFNMPFDSSIRDECRYYGCPHMRSHHSRDEFERIMKENRASKYKRKKLQRHSNSSKRSKSSQDEADASDNAASEGSGEDKALKDTNNDDKMETVDSSKTEDEKSTDLIDDSVDSQEYQNSTITAENDSSTQSSGTEIDRTPVAATNSGVTDTDSPSTPACVHKPVQHRSLSKSFNYGVGIPGTTTPEQSPSADKWSVGISGHIDFDNIPESTGKWDKINKIMGRVRLEMSNLHDDD